MKYFKDFYYKGKYIGSLVCEKDREIFGFMGRKKEVFDTEFKLSNNKIVKPFLEYITELQLLEGRK